MSTELVDKIIEDYKEQENGVRQSFRRRFIIYSLSACIVFDAAKFFMLWGNLTFGYSIDIVSLILIFFSFAFIFPLLVASIFVKKYLGIVILAIAVAILLICCWIPKYLHLNYNPNDYLFFFLKIVWLPFLIGLGLTVIDFNFFGIFGSKKGE
jgi:hypothetical protein